MTSRLELGSSRCGVADTATRFRNCFSVGGIGVEISGGREDVRLIPSLSSFQTNPSPADIQIHVEWVSELSPIPGAKLFDSGSVWRLYEDKSGFRFDFTAPPFGAKPYKRLLADSEFRRVHLWMSHEVFANSPDAVIAPLDYPLDELLIMHRLTREKAIELHGCGIVESDGMGNLFVGHSGAGKSTTTRLWTERVDVEVLSDDRIILRREPSARNNDHPSGMRMYGTPWHGEARYASPANAPLRRIFVLEHGKGNVLTPLTPSQAVAELFARSFVPFHRHEYVESALDFLQEVADSVPCYGYAFEPDQRAVETILNLHD